MSLGTAVLIEGAIVICVVISAFKLSFPFPSRVNAKRRGIEAAYKRADDARRAADARYFKEHQIERRLLPLSVNAFLVAFGSTFLCVSFANDLSKGLGRALAVLGVSVQIVCLIIFVTINLQKRSAVLSKIQQAWRDEER